MFKGRARGGIKQTMPSSDELSDHVFTQASPQNTWIFLPFFPQMLLCWSGHCKHFHTDGSRSLIHLYSEAKLSSWVSTSSSPARNGEREAWLLSVLFADTFVGLSFWTGAGVYRKENDWEQKMEGRQVQRCNFKSEGMLETLSLSVTQRQGHLAEATYACGEKW